MTTDIHAATQAIREALATFPKGWLTAFHEVREREPGVAEIGIFWEDTDSLAEVVTVDTGNYYDNAAAMPVARFIAACNPEAITTILAALEARDAEIAALREDAERYRLLRRGQRWSVIDGIGDTLRAERLDAAVDQARKGGA